MSSMYRRWLIVTPLVSVSTLCDDVAEKIQDYAEQKQEVHHLGICCAIVLELASCVIFHSCTELLMKLISALLGLHSAKHSSIHLWGIEL